MIYVGILAAGVGVRRNRQDLPIQFTNLGSKPIIVHTVEQFYINNQIDNIIIVAPDDWSQYAEDLVNQYDKMSKEVSVITGGVNKTLSILSIVEHIEKQWGINDDDIIIVHDSVRPFITQRVIKDNIDVAKKHGAVSTVMTTGDTIIVTRDGENLHEIPEKGYMLAEQTPMTFNLKLLAEMFKKARDNNVPMENETELARMYISNGYKMKLVMGEYSNMKILNSYDLEVAEALLRELKL